MELRALWLAQERTILIRHPENESVVSWVLSPFNNYQQKLMDAAFETSENVINDFIKGKNAQYLMNQYNQNEHYRVNKKR